MKFIKDNFFFILLFAFSTLIVFVNIQMNVFRYNNFDFGKFDLGNMTQMEWNTLHGRVLYLTDYFGTNLPRFAMSHVDPILLLFVPLFASFPHPLTLVISQLVLLIFSSLLIFKITELELNSKFAGLLMGISFIFYPAIGFLTALTGFHGVTAAIPFFLGAFYVFEKMHKAQNFSKKWLVLFWVLLIISLSGKEQISLYAIMYGLFLWLFRNKRYLGLTVSFVGLAWFIIAFFLIIPYYARYRIEGYKKFAESLHLDTTVTRDVENENYFLSRYADFGDSYTQVFFGILSHPNKAISVIFDGDKINNLKQTFEPVGYFPLANPALLAVALPDLLINYLTTAGGIGTAEIYNHRISMIIPIIFLSIIYAVSLAASFVSKNSKSGKKLIQTVLCVIILLLNLKSTIDYNNPVYLWLNQAIRKRLSSIAFAKTNSVIGRKEDLNIGDVFKITPLENKDRECANKIVKMIPANASVSGPDYLGAHLAQRETYAIFPALYNQANYVIVDVFSKKILTILDIDLNLVKDVVGWIVEDPNYELELGCGNLFVFKNIGQHGKSVLLPIQEKYKYDEVYNYEIFQTLTLVDYSIPNELKKGDLNTVKLVYTKRESNSLNDYILFMTFINTDTGEIYQFANLPTFGLTQPKDFTRGRYYIEELAVRAPAYLSSGKYKAFIGMYNNVRTRSIYLGDINID